MLSETGWRFINHSSLGENSTSLAGSIHGSQLPVCMLNTFAFFGTCNGYTHLTDIIARM